MLMVTTGWRQNNMPELPEVETVRRALESRYLNKVIDNVDVYYPKIIENVDVDTFKSKVKGAKILSFNRYGKHLYLTLDKCYILFHLRMEGKFKYDMELFDKHSHVVFHFTDGDVLIYHDVRKFGRINYFDKGVDIFSEKPLNKLGKEPKDIGDETYLLDKFSKMKIEIKSALLDQSIICGIGNIYADEILFASGICPTKSAKDITKKEAKAILSNARIILEMATKDGGSTIKSFQSQHGVDGLFQQHLKVYGKEGCPCPKCGEKIVKIKLHGRGTCYCPQCQKSR